MKENLPFSPHHSTHEIISSPPSDYGVAVAYGILCIAGGLFDLLGLLGDKGWGQIELGVDSVIYFGTGVLLLRRSRFAYPAVFAGIVPMAWALAYRGLSPFHLLSPMALLGMLVYLKQRRHLLR